MLRRSRDPVPCELSNRAVREERTQWATLILIVLFANGIFPLSAPAQQIPAQELRFDTQPYKPAAILRVERRVIQVDVVVRDPKRNVVRGLTRQDFKLYDKGKEQAISLFTVVSATPSTMSRPTSSPTPAPESTASSPAPNEQRYLALFFDDRNTPFGDLAYAREAAERFVQQDLRSADEVGIFTASGTPILDFTSGTQKLLQTIQSVRWQPPDSHPMGCPGAPKSMGSYIAYLIMDQGDIEARNLLGCGSTPSEDSATQIVAAAVLSASENISKFSLSSVDSVIARLAGLPGHRIVVLTSSGFFTASLQPQLDQVVSDALDTGVVINSLDAKGLVARAPGGDAKDSLTSISEQQNVYLKKERESMDDVMADLARDTGGIFFHNNNDLELGLREMAEVPEVSYRLGFSPADLKPDGKFHDLKVKLVIPGSFEIQARRGYFAPTEAAAKAEGKADTFNNEVMKSDELNALPAEIGAQAGRLAAGGTGFQISLRVDPRALSFQKDHGRHFDKLNLITALFSSDGKFVTGEMGIVNMALSNKSLDDLSQRGLSTTIVLPAPEGRYRLRVVMEDASSGKVFATTRPVSIP